MSEMLSKFLKGSKFFVFFSLILILSLRVHAYPDDICKEWFKKTKIVIDAKSCENKCVIAMIDMRTFQCHSQCVELCSENSISKYVFYPGLTSKEKALIDKYPKEAMIVFVEKMRAEESSLRQFPIQRFNDEGDAFRHYIWAGLLTKELGSEMAQTFLDAHEENPLQPNEERSMDLANNRGGILSAQKLQKENKLDLKNLENQALDDLRANKLIVLKPALSIPKEAK
jgi:hypothetical protein